MVKILPDAFLKKICHKINMLFQNKSLHFFRYYLCWHLMRSIFECAIWLGTNTSRRYSTAFIIFLNLRFNSSYQNPLTENWFEKSPTNLEFYSFEFHHYMFLSSVFDDFLLIRKILWKKTRYVKGKYWHDNVISWSDKKLLEMNDQHNFEMCKGAFKNA